MPGRSQPSGRAGRERRERFFRWQRCVPIVVLAMTLAFAGGLAAAPLGLVRSLVYPVEHVDVIESASARYGVDPDLVCAVIKCESGWDEGAVSHAGAVGLMQVMPSTAESLNGLGIVDAAAYDPARLSDPEVNIEYGCAYLGYLQTHLSSLDEVIAAYNAGIGAVQGWIADGASIPEGIEYAETRAYLDRVRGAYEGYQSSYPDGLPASDADGGSATGA